MLSWDNFMYKNRCVRLEHIYCMKMIELSREDVTYLFSIRHDTQFLSHLGR
jgi:hypothetical protein